MQGALEFSSTLHPKIEVNYELATATARKTAAVTTTITIATTTHVAKVTRTKASI